MIHLANKLDEWGFYHEADKFEKLILANNNFVLTKKRKNPLQPVLTEINALSTKLTDYMDNNNNSSGGDPANDITVTKTPKGESEILEFEIN